MRSENAQHHPALDGLVAFVWENKDKMEPPKRKQPISGIRLEPGYRPDMVFSLTAEKYKLGPYLTPATIAQMLDQETVPSVRDYGSRAYDDVSEKGSESVYHLGLSTRTRFYALRNAGTITDLRELARTNPIGLSYAMRGEILTKLRRFDSQVELLSAFNYGYEDLATADRRMEERIRRIVPSDQFPLTTGSSTSAQV